MDALLFIVALAAAVAAYIFYRRWNQSRADLQAAEAHHRQEVDELAPFRAIKDAAAALKVAQERAKSVIAEAEAAVARARKAAEDEIDQDQRQHKQELKQTAAQAEQRLVDAMQQAERIIQEAQKRAQDIAGEALLAKQQSAALTHAAKAMQNVINGYGDRYLIPTYALLDELADRYGFDDAGKELKMARDRVRLMIESGRAATCDYVEPERRATAIKFVVDAFNGKVDSILTKVRAENAGTLLQQIRDAFALVNHNGAAFKNARISQEYLDTRLNELQWASAVQALREREREEQRVIRERIRDEERAQREFERAQKEAEREELMLRKAMEKAQAQLAKASDAQRAEFEAKLADLQTKLTEAELKGQRALSMAQQTKVGHVYVISNIGSFGEDVVKIGMTRRLEPLDRVQELGDASVPFPFDVHAMIHSDDAPQLERQLHLRFLDRQINKVNPRKEFFKLGVGEIKAAVEERGLKASWTLASIAAEYRESLEVEIRIRESAAAKREWEAAQRVADPVTPEVVAEPG